MWVASIHKIKMIFLLTEYELVSFYYYFNAIRHEGKKILYNYYSSDLNVNRDRNYKV